MGLNKLNETKEISKENKFKLFFSHFNFDKATQKRLANDTSLIDKTDYECFKNILPLEGMIRVFIMPTRFGKTTLLSFIEEYYKENYFCIRLDFGDSQIYEKDDYIEGLKCKIARLFYRFKDKVSTLDEYEAENFNKYLGKKVTNKELEQALSDLCDYINKFLSSSCAKENKKIILIDNYDVPLLSAYQKHMENPEKFNFKWVQTISWVFSNLVNHANDSKLATIIAMGSAKFAGYGVFSNDQKTKVHYLNYNNEEFKELFGFTKKEINKGFTNTNKPLKVSEIFNKSCGGYGESRDLCHPYLIMCKLKNDAGFRPSHLISLHIQLILKKHTDLLLIVLQQIKDNKPFKWFNIRMAFNLEVLINSKGKTVSQTAQEICLVRFLYTAGYLAVMKEDEISKTLLLRIPNKNLEQAFCDLLKVESLLSQPDQINTLSFERN